MKPLTTDYHQLIGERLAAGRTMRQVATELGFTYGQVKGAVERHRLRQTPATLGRSPFSRKQKGRMIDLLCERIRQGETLPTIAKEVYRRTGKRISSNALRDWVPEELAPVVQENAKRRAKITARQNGRTLHRRIAELEEENRNLRAELSRIRDARKIVKQGAA